MLVVANLFAAKATKVATTNADKSYYKQRQKTDLLHLDMEVFREKPLYLFFLQLDRR